MHGLTAVASASPSSNRDLDDELARCYADPLRFVRLMYDWPINGEPGPDVWQREVLADLGAAVTARRFYGHTPVLPIRVAISSGHGVGKSSLFAWIVNWLMATRPDCSRSSPAARRSTVDLPQPEGPSRHTTSPGPTLRLKPATARKRP